MGLYGSAKDGARPSVSGPLAPYVVLTVQHTMSLCRFGDAMVSVQNR